MKIPFLGRRRSTPDSAGWALVPASERDIQAVADQCRGLVRERALLAAGVAMVPVPGLDWLTDVGVLVKLLPEINRRFGLTPGQVERLAPERRLVAFKALSAGSGLLVGKVVTRELVMTLLRVVGVRLTTQQAAKFVPVAGQAVSAALTWTALRYVCEQHIRQCIAVSREIAAASPPAEEVVVEVSPPSPPEPAARSDSPRSASPAAPRAGGRPAATA